MRTVHGVLAIVLSVPLAAQPEESARLVRNGSSATLIVSDRRPLDAAATLLAKEFGLQVNVEDPLYFHRYDIEDVTTLVSRVSKPLKRTFVPRTRLIEVTFDVTPDGAPRDVPALLQSLVDASNDETPFAYRVDRDRDVFSLIPTRTRDAQGRVIDATPILDRRITIPQGTRRVFEHVNMLTDALAKQTGVHVSCCQAGVAGIAWGSTVTSFEAHDEQARTALLRLVRSERGQYHWLMRCQPAEAWCFINVVRVQRSSSSPVDPLAASSTTFPRRFSIVSTSPRSACTAIACDRESRCKSARSLSEMSA